MTRGTLASATAPPALFLRRSGEVAAPTSLAFALELDYRQVRFLSNCEDCCTY